MTDQDLKQMERATFRAAADTGLWDILLASVFGFFAIAPLLSDRLGDFWSSAVLLPVWGAVYAMIWLVHRRVVVPRIGVIEFGPARRARIRKLALIMLVANVVALALGFIAATRATAGVDSASPAVFPIGLSLTLLCGLSLAAYLLDIPRLFFYGVLLAGAPVVGEQLFQRGYASHHGFPLVFGIAAGVILVSGLVRFRRVLPPKAAASEISAGEGSHE